MEAENIFEHFSILDSKFIFTYVTMIFKSPHYIK